MKLKILLVPSLIVAVIILLIWVIYPAYSSPLTNDGLAEKLAQLSQEKDKMVQVKQKSKNVDILNSQLSSESDRKAIVMKYVPETAKEEEIIDNLNFIATSEGLSVFNLSVIKDKDSEISDAQTVPSAAGGTLASPASSDSSIVSDVPVMSVRPKPSNLTVQYSVIGNYDKIKNVLEKVYGFERFNKVISLEIKKPTSSEGKAETGDALEADAILSFKFIKKISTLADLEDPAFSNSKFDLAVTEKIRTEKRVNALNLEAGSTGKTNPFTP
jgi:hypothetical protein